MKKRLNKVELNRVLRAPMELQLAKEEWNYAVNYKVGIVLILLKARGQNG